MATFVSTTLAKRSGTNTVFAPQGIESGVGTLAESGSFQSGFANRLTLSSRRSGGNKRITRMKFAVPLLDVTNVNAPRKLSECTAELVVNVPDGTPSANVNDLIGYVAASCATGITNLNAVLVTGEGVY